MTEKRFVADNEYVMQDNQVYVVCSGEHSADVVATALNELLDENEQLKQQIQKSNQEVVACHDTLVTIEALCDAVLNYDFKNIESKVDFCHMLNELDNKDLMFFKECFEAIRGNDLRKMSSLTMECLE